MALKHGRMMWLLTAALLVAPLGGVILMLYGAGRLILRKRLETAIDPYAEWLALRDRMRSRADAAAGED
ncbi:MAG: hypothetical protein ACREJ9_10220 [Candidatus Rokuibacteriota bacterium]